MGVETDSKTEVNFFSPLLTVQREGGNVKHFLNILSWFYFFSIHCINSWEDKICLKKKILSAWVKDYILNCFLLPSSHPSCSNCYQLWWTKILSLKQCLKCSEMIYYFQRLEFLKDSSIPNCSGLRFTCDLFVWNCNMLCEEFI